MEPALPVAELEGIYERIVGAEIVVRGEAPSAAAAAGAAAGAGGARATAQARNRLAAAVGWTQLSLPWRALGGWDKAKGVDAERKLVLELAEKEVARAALSGNVWHSATHAEHARPMLQVAGRWLLDALAASYARTEDPPAAEPLLQGLLQLARLAGLLGLDGLCEQAVGALASAAGVFAPAPPGSAAERQQLSALLALMSLTAGPEAGLLGSSWMIVLRCVSALEALHQELRRPPPPTVSSPVRDAAAGTSTFARMFGGFFGAAAPTATSPPGSGGGAAAMTSPPPQQQQQQQQHQRHGGGSWSGGRRDSLDGTGGGAASPTDVDGGAPIRNEPGAGLVAWAASPEGRAAVARIYTRSASLDGDAVVVFMRALCAVSQEELESSAGSAAPRLHSLQKVVECAFINMGRIRLVWSKLWAVVGAQLVGASCGQSRAVALYAVDALRQLVAKLLARAELAHFAHQVRGFWGREGVLRTLLALSSPAASCTKRRPPIESNTQSDRRTPSARLWPSCASATSPRSASWPSSASCRRWPPTRAASAPAGAW
jgi:brefeldin A-inhibited guanine nucleotide-exchange protein